MDEREELFNALDICAYHLQEWLDGKKTDERLAWDAVKQAKSVLNKIHKQKMGNPAKGFGGFIEA